MDLGLSRHWDTGTEKEDAAVGRQEARIDRNGAGSSEAGHSFSFFYLPTLFVNEHASSIINPLFQLKLWLRGSIMPLLGQSCILSALVLSAPGAGWAHQGGAGGPLVHSFPLPTSNASKLKGVYAPGKSQGLSVLHNNSFQV